MSEENGKIEDVLIDTKEVKEIVEESQLIQKTVEIPSSTEIDEKEGVEAPAIAMPEFKNEVDNSDAFITEDDTFDIKISYYKVGGDIFVESVDEEFDVNNSNLKNIDITFKYPSQGDYESILSQNAYKSPDKMTLMDVMQMELTRLVILIRKWSLNAEFTRMIELNPKIVKAIVNKVREKIGVNGIL